MGRLKFATVWLGGCSGCHMSFLDLDEWLIDLAQRIDVVYSPVADIKEYPENVDLVLVEGAVANEENLHMIQKVRARTKTLIALGDCAITGNVTALRNPLGVALEVLRPVYGDNYPERAGNRAGPARPSAARTSGGTGRFLSAGLSAAGEPHQAGIAGPAGREDARAGRKRNSLRLAACGIALAVNFYSFPNSVWERKPAKLRFACRPAARSLETEFRRLRSQTEFGNEGKDYHGKTHYHRPRLAHRRPRQDHDLSRRSAIR